MVLLVAAGPGRTVMPSSRDAETPLAEFTLAGNALNVSRYLEPDVVASEPSWVPGEALGALGAWLPGLP